MQYFTLKILSYCYKKWPAKSKGLIKALKWPLVEPSRMSYSGVDVYLCSQDTTAAHNPLKARTKIEVNIPHKAKSNDGNVVPGADMVPLIPPKFIVLGWSNITPNAPTTIENIINTRPKKPKHRAANSKSFRFVVCNFE
tara:strand:- start:928 stop:1344 length:417 start_codon:yes stop_codon:yes gene_type:complete